MKNHMWKRGGIGVALFWAAVYVLISAAPVTALGPGAELAEYYLKKTPVTSFSATMSASEGMAAQQEFIDFISKEYGEPVGYKAGLTNPNAQKMFGVSQPVRGTLLSKMILKNGATVPADFGSVPVTEGDLVVRVGDEKINEAGTPADTLKYLDAVFPFLELADIVFAKGVKLTGAAVMAINVGARLGVIGDPIPLGATPEWGDRLRSFSLQIVDEKGAVVGEARGNSLLGDPLNVVLWIKDSLVMEGKRLKKGDLLSLGSVTRPMPVKPGSTVRARYIGLDPKGPVEIYAVFK